MDDPVTRCLLPDPLLDERLLGAEELHGELVVGRLEHALQVVADPAGLRVDGRLVVVLFVDRQAGAVAGGILTLMLRTGLKLGANNTATLKWFNTDLFCRL